MQTLTSPHLSSKIISIPIEEGDMKGKVYKHRSALAQGKGMDMQKVFSTVLCQSRF